MRWRFGSFSLLHIMSALTANRSVSWPDADGTIGLMRTLTTFSSAVPFNANVTSYNSHTVAAAISFTIASGTKIAGCRTIYRLVANGTNMPTFTGFKTRDRDSGYDNRNGILNVIEFFYDGVDHWVEVWQEKGALPAFVSIGLNFPNQTGGTINKAGQVYTVTQNTGNGFFNSAMASAEAIPQNKAGRITVRVGANSVVALNNLNNAELTTTSIGNGNFEYFAWLSGTIFSGSLSASQDSTINPGVANPYLRFTRNGLGVVTLEWSANNTTWNAVRTYSNTTLDALYVGAALSFSGSPTFEVVAFEVEP